MKRSPDATDDFLLAMSEAGKADYLVTGDKSGLLRLRAASHDRDFQLRQFGSDQHVSYMIVF